MTPRRLNVAVTCENAAFENDPGPECARILRKIADQIEAGHDAKTIFDANGNDVGRWRLTTRPE
jgi:hypothetical protein